MVKKFFPETDAYHTTKKYHVFKVVRAGNPVSFYDRGGTWYEVRLWDDYMSSYKGRYYGIGGNSIFTDTIKLRKPYFFKIPDINSEGEISIKLWEHVTKKKLPNRRGLYGFNAEKVYSKLEREVADVLSSKGYDGVVLYYQPGVPGTRYPSQIFVFNK